MLDPRAAPPITPLLPQAAAHLVRAKPLPRMGPLGMMVCAATLWAAGLTALTHVYVREVAVVIPAAVDTTHAKPVRVVLALADARQTTRYQLTDNSEPSVAVLAGHVAQSLLRDQFDSVILKVSLGRQVVEHLHHQWLQRR